MKYLFLFIGLFFSLTSSGQSSRWQKTYGHQYYNQGVDICELLDSNYIFLANRSGFNSNSGFYLAKIDTAGSLLWDQQYEIDPFAKAYDLCNDSAGNVYICGIAYDQNTSLYTGFISKVKDNGKLIWYKHYGIHNQDHLKSIKLNNNEIYCGGITHNDSLATQNWIIHCDTAGNVLEQNIFGTVFNDYLSDICVTDSSLYTCGFYLNNHTDSIATLYKHSEFDSLLWQKNFNTNQNPALFRAIKKNDLNDDIFLVGSINNLPSYGLSGFLLKLNAQGDSIYSFINSGTLKEETFDLTVFQNEITTLSYTTTYGQGNEADFLVSRTNSGGWWVSPNGIAGGAKLEIPSRIIRTCDDSYLCIGTTLSYGEGIENILVAKFNSNREINPWSNHQTVLAEPQIVEYKVFPNPTTNILNINLNDKNQEQKTIILYDLQGKIILHKQFINNNLQLSISHLKTGIYFIRLIANNQVQLIKFEKI